jgi:TetR/AcrR family transcriptional repressor of nem operon
MPQINLKEQLVEGATDVFHRQGFNASTVDDIVRAAGVPKGSFYNHFDSKESLALEVAKRYASSTPTDMLAMPGLSPVARVRAHFEFMVERTVRQGLERGCILGNFGTELAAQSAVISRAVRDAFDVWSSGVAMVLEEARELGEIAADVDTQALADFMIDSFEGATARAKVSGNRKPLDHFLEITFTKLLR